MMGGCIREIFPNNLSLYPSVTPLCLPHPGVGHQELRSWPLQVLETFQGYKKMAKKSCEVNVQGLCCVCGLLIPPASKRNFICSNIMGIHPEISPKHKVIFKLGVSGAMAMKSWYLGQVGN